jgi:hypothetical protein
MRTWKLHLDDPKHLVLAADPRLSPLSYANDQIWELMIGRSDPAAVVLQTTFGLRARSMRIFPQFVESHQTVSNPAEFDTPLTIVEFAPNYAKLKFSPYPGIDVLMEYWIPDSQTAAGRVWIENVGDLERKLRFEMAVVLTPNPEGRPMVPRKREATTILQGQTEDLSPIFFITGGAEGEASPYPNLFHNLELAPGQFRRFTWIQTALPDEEEAFRHARLTASQNWDAEIIRIKMLASQLPEIYTGEPDWDAALAFSQKAALNLLFAASEHLPHTSFVSTRLPDQGYSQQGSGAEYNHLWNGQTPLEAWYLSHFLLPGNSAIATGVLENFIHHQQENGFVDHKPGLGGQRSSLSAAPFLVSLAWRIYQFTEDRTFLSRVFRPLLWYLQTWFWESNDRDSDGIPEWGNLVQTGYDENPFFSRWQPWAQGTEITAVESPDLSAYLYRETVLLKKIAEITDQKEPLTYLEALSNNLHSAVQNSWNGRRGSFQYWDRDSHETQKGENLGERTGSGEILIDLVFDLPTRLQIRLEAEDSPKPQVEISIHGYLPNGQHRVETIQPEYLVWVQGICIYTLPNLYSEIEHIHISGLPSKGRAVLQVTDHYQDDHTLLTPIWAKMVTEKQLDRILERKLFNDRFYNQPYGIPALPKPNTKEAEETGLLTWLPWNAMVVEGLLEYGETEKAAEIFSRLMQAIIHNLKQEDSFRTFYHSSQLSASGQRNHLIGLPSAGLFLEIVGIRPISPWKVQVLHKNPFPWPVRICYHGTWIISSDEQVEIRFLDGERTVISDQIPCLVENIPTQLEEET